MDDRKTFLLIVAFLTAGLLIGAILGESTGNAIRRNPNDRDLNSPLLRCDYDDSKPDGSVFCCPLGTIGRGSKCGYVKLGEA